MRLVIALSLPALLALACVKPAADVPNGTATAGARVASQRFAPNAVPPPAFAERTKEKLSAAFPEIEKIFADWKEREHAPSVAYGVVVDGELVFSRGLGARDVGSKEVPDADTDYRIASMTK